MARIHEAGERAFAGETGLVTQQVERAVERVQAAGGEATMAMLGETVVATGVEGVLAEGTRVRSGGAHVR